MAYKPSDVYVGIIDLFSIILPGALLSYLAVHFARTEVVGIILPEIKGEIQGWIAFFFASYLFGHFVFLMGIGLDIIYQKTYLEWKKKSGGDELFLHATEIQKKALGELPRSRTALKKETYELSATCLQNSSSKNSSLSSRGIGPCNNLISFFAKCWRSTRNPRCNHFVDSRFTFLLIEICPKPLELKIDS